MRGVGRGRRSLDLQSNEPSLEEARLRAALLSRMFGETSRPPKLGRYEVRHKVGAGAMGVVYEGYDPELERSVALKVLHGGADEWVLAEGRAMAAIDHPNVAKVYEVGVEDDRVFIAMELVRGHSLRHWLNEGLERGSYRDCLEVFIQAGAGLAAVHRAGVVHRDFKPDNVLLGSDGRVRVVDFGLARSGNPIARPSEEVSLEVERDLGDPTLTGAIAGTPAYMAPELFKGEPADARSDQFAYCASFFEGLYGVTPYRGRTLRELDARAQSGEIDWAHASGRAPGWLRAVLERGLRVEAGARYPSMEALLTDLGRRPRRRGIMLGGVGVAIVVSLGTRSASIEEGGSCPLATQHLEGVWDARSRAAVRFTLRDRSAPYAEDTLARVERDLDAYSQEWLATHQDACEATRRGGERSGALLDARMRCLEGRLRALRAATQTLSRTDGVLVDKAVDLVAALPRLDKCRDSTYVLAAVPPPDDPHTAAVVDDVEQDIATARALETGGRYEDAIGLARRALKRAYGLEYVPSRARAQHALGSAQLRRGLIEAAESNLRDAYHESLAAGDREGAARAAADLCVLLARDKFEFEDALMWARFAEAAAGSDPALRAAVANARGIAQVHDQRFEAAASSFREALGDLEAATNPDGPQVAEVRLNVARVVKLTGKPSEALEMAEQAHGELRASLGPAHPRVAAAGFTVAQLLMMLDRGPEALPLLLDVRDVMAASQGEDHPMTIEVRIALGRHYRIVGNLQAAREELEGALAVFQGDGDPNGVGSFAVLEELAAVHADAGRPELALSFLRRSTEQAERAFGPAHADYAIALGKLAEGLVAADRPAEALDPIDRAIVIFEASAGAQSMNVAMALLVRANAWAASDRLDAAQADLERALAIREGHFGPRSPALSDALVPLAEIHLDRGRFDEAVAAAERALAVVTGVDGIPEHQRARVQWILAQSRWTAGSDRDQALDLARQAAAALRAGPVSSQALADEVDQWLVARQ